MARWMAKERPRYWDGDGEIVAREKLEQAKKIIESYYHLEKSIYGESLPDDVPIMLVSEGPEAERLRVCSSLLAGSDDYELMRTLRWLRENGWKVETGSDGQTTIRNPKGDIDAPPDYLRTDYRGIKHYMRLNIEKMSTRETKDILHSIFQRRPPAILSDVRRKEVGQTEKEQES